jgi:hypothetical protein
VLLIVPEVALFPLNELAGAFARFLPAEIATVRQAFTGPLKGGALLLLNCAGAISL